jgi:hypothetical protein
MAFEYVNAGAAGEREVVIVGSRFSHFLRAARTASDWLQRRRIMCGSGARRKTGFIGSAEKTYP